MFTLVSRAVARGAAMLVLLGSSVAAQSATAASLVRRALDANPRIRAASLQFDAARQRIAPAGAWSDPMLMVGVQNQPLSSAMATGPEPMAMRMLGVAQTLPYPGKTSLRTQAARAEADAAAARLAGVTRDVRREVLDAWSDLVAARSLLAVFDRQQEVAASVLPATEARYVSGSAAQADVLRGRTEAALVVEERNMAVEEEQAALARLAAATDDDRPIASAADAFPTVGPRSPFLPLADLVARALQANPRLRERRAMLVTQTAQAELASREHLPDVNVGVQYGQRDALPDMVTAVVSVPLPLQRSRKQSAAARAARFDASAAEAALRAEENAVRAEVARAYASVQRQRANLDLLRRFVVPQAGATFASSAATYQSGRGELLGVLDAMRALFAAETMSIRTVAGYAKSLNELEWLAGQEVSP